MILTTVKNINYELLTLKDLDEATQILVDSFSSREPMAVSIKPDKSEFFPLYHIICKTAVTENLSIIARDIHSNKIVGSMINEDYITGGLATCLDNLDTHCFAPIISLLEELNNKAPDLKSAKQGEYFHLYMLGLHADFRGYNYDITRTFMNIGIDMARKKGFKNMLIEATGSTTQWGAKEFYNFKTLSSVVYKTFTYDNMYFFKDIESIDACRLMVKEL